MNTIQEPLEEYDKGFDMASALPRSQANPFVRCNGSVDGRKSIIPMGPEEPIATVLVSGTAGHPHRSPVNLLTAHCYSRAMKRINTILRMWLISAVMRREKERMTLTDSFPS